MCVMYDPNRNELVVADREGHQLRNLPAEELSPQSIAELVIVGWADAVACQTHWTLPRY